jgi:hypothetical protein
VILWLLIIWVQVIKEGLTMAYRNQILVFAVSFLIIGFLLLSLPRLTSPAYAGLPGLATCCDRTQTMQGPICIDPNDDCTIDFEGNSCGTCDPGDVGQPCECSTSAPSPNQELITNGNFETGDTSGWSVFTDCAFQTGGAAVFEAYTGTTAPITDNMILAPPQGMHAAISDYNGTATASTALYQEIAVPSNQSVSCSLIYYYNSFGQFISGQGLECDEDNNQTARIDIMKPGSGAFDTGDGVLENLYQTEPGDPLMLGYTTLNFDLTEYAGSWPAPL